MSSKPKLIYYRMLNFQQDNMDLLKENFDVIVLDDPTQDDDIELLDVVVSFAPLGFYFNAEKMDRMPALRIIASNTTSVPHIDEAAAKERGIKVISLREELAFLRTITPTAELTWGLMLTMMRNIPGAFRSVLDGQWSRWPFGAPRMLSRMTLGLVGIGRIGEIVARYGVAFGMPVYYYDPYVEIPPVEGVSKVDSLEELVSLSDVVSLHLHLTDETRNLFNAALFDKFREGSYLINTSRGAIVETAAMLAALESGRLAGAAIDVLDDEFEQGFNKSVKEHPLVRYAATHDNLVITPHIAGSTVDAWHLTQKHTIKRALEELAKMEVA
ncbi:D-isomer specific 2-hydroxyacid dehydrogenase family protein [Thiohalobacter sp. IOR34]|uniref:NAD(P)-dependent oxidoreductase n=1 Tax=Thiohalobacter sp. IOR34 TaxID=3057176 RepID=UPI0025B2622B|nr:D-isomer specific 2-hydroxyacid dehydrogenase family protein [Thiohalobacter sp. IOR34]WJW76704.1 D-isomer specific 2-hydroxyacid dehydrogenase family protein [Thiohalobacter sp. IOR34]